MHNMRGAVAFQEAAAIGAVAVGAVAVGAAVVMSSQPQQPPRPHAPTVMYTQPVYMQQAGRHVPPQPVPLWQGWLIKQAVSAPALFKTWKRRWLVVWPDRVTWHAQPNPHSQPNSWMQLRVDANLATSSMRPLELALVCMGKELILRAEDTPQLQTLHAALEAALLALRSPHAPANGTAACSVATAVPMAVPTAVPMAVPMAMPDAPATVSTGTPVAVVTEPPAIPPATPSGLYPTLT